MLTISKPLSASQAQTYHVREFAAQEQNYWSPISGVTVSGRADSPSSGGCKVRLVPNTLHD
jgi:hypothetical protein